MVRSRATVRGHITLGAGTITNPKSYVPSELEEVFDIAWGGVVTLSQTERNLPTIANVDARDFKDLACWLIVQIGPISLNVTTPACVLLLDGLWSQETGA